MKARGLGPAVNPLAVACPKCTRGVGKPCAKRIQAKDADPMAGVFWMDWAGTSKRCHSERVTAAIQQKESK